MVFASSVFVSGGLFIKFPIQLLLSYKFCVPSLASTELTESDPSSCFFPRLNSNPYACILEIDWNLYLGV
jgi:hypothetical protein